MRNTPTGRGSDWPTILGFLKNDSMRRDERLEGEQGFGLDTGYLLPGDPGHSRAGLYWKPAMSFRCLVSG